MKYLKKNNLIKISSLSLPATTVRKTGSILKEDPNETKDLVQALPEKLGELCKSMIELHVEVGAKGPVLPTLQSKEKE